MCVCHRERGILVEANFQGILENRLKTQPVVVENRPHWDHKMLLEVLTERLEVVIVERFLVLRVLALLLLGDCHLKRTKLVEGKPWPYNEHAVRRCHGCTQSVVSLEHELLQPIFL